MGSVLVDRNQLEMSLLNLAVNARDAMPRGGAITIEAREQELAASNAFALPVGRYAVLSITDHGEGMDETTLQRATEPFFTTKGVGKGTGLGLSMVHGLAEQSGGRFVLKSKPGEGTTASLWLPIVKGAPGSAHGVTMIDDASFALSKPLAILAVDDDALVLMNTAAMLDDRGSPRDDGLFGQGSAQDPAQRRDVRPANHRSGDARHDGGRTDRDRARREA
jgi:hypothetical protein